VERHKLATAGVVAVTTFGATVALGANLGLFGLAQPSPHIGRLPAAPTATTTTVAAAVHTATRDD
jgi:hypothetical protein